MKKQIGIFTAILFAVSTLMVGCKAEVHTHTFAEEWSSDETSHWHAATCGCSDVELQKTEHTFGDWITTKAATEEETGSKEKSCSVCEYTVTEEIAKLEHTHTFGEWNVTKEPTEEAKGTKERVCDVCKYKETAEIAQLNHKHVAGESWKNDDKNHWKECTGCKEKIDVKEHIYSESWTKDASGHWYECVCGAKKDFEEHTYGTWKVGPEPTDTQAGRNERTCKDCGYVADSVVLQPAPEGFRFVKGGTITGSAYTNNYEGVFIEGRTVTLSDFYMGKYEVTQEEYASVMEGQKVTVNGTEYALESNPNYCTKDSKEYTLFNGDVQEKRPVEGVIWYDAVWYCNALSEKEGLTKAYNIGVTRVEQASGKTGYYIYSANITLNNNATGYRLPTEAEWEYAARGGDPTAADWNYVFSGADTAEGVSYDNDKNAGLDSVGWYCYNNITGITVDSVVTNNVSGRGTHQVGMKAPNRLGLYDMSGNVCEWCYDRKGTITTTTPADGATSGRFRVYRGVSWGGYAGFASVSCRDGLNPSSRDAGVGFRVVCPSSK